MASNFSPACDQSRRISKASASIQSTSAADARAIGLEIALRHFQRGARGVDARHLAADLGEMQGKSALVAADVERAADCIPGAAPTRAPRRSWCADRETRRSSGRRWRRSERRGRSDETRWPRRDRRALRRRAIKASGLGAGRPSISRMRGSGRSKIAAGASSSRRTRTHVSRTPACEQTFGQELQYDDLAVLVHDQAGQLVGLAEAKAAGVVGSVEQRLAARDGRAQARCEQLEPRGLVEASRETRRNAICDSRTVKRRAEKDASLVGNRQSSSLLVLEERLTRTSDA